MVEAQISNVTVLWAQRKRFVYLKVEAKNINESQAQISFVPPNIVKLDAQNRVNGLVYHMNLELWHDIWIEKSSWKVTDSNVQFNITKKWRKIGFWPGLLKKEGKFRFLKVDWDRWEDPEHIKPENLLGENIDLEDFDDLSQDSDSQGENDDLPEHLRKPEEVPPPQQTKDSKCEESKDKQGEAEKQEADEDSEEDIVPEHLRD